MPNIRERITAFLIPKIKFAGTSGIATIIDYGLTFILLNLFGLQGTITWAGITFKLANSFGVAAGMISNFLLQKRFVFATNRNIYLVFFMTLSFSILGFFVNQWLFSILRDKVEYLSQHTFITKVIVTVMMFLFNFYTKRFSFEKSLPGASQKS